MPPVQSPKQPKFEEVNKAYDYAVAMQAAFMEHRWGKNIPDKDANFISQFTERLQSMANYLFNISHTKE